MSEGLTTTTGKMSVGTIQAHAVNGQSPVETAYMGLKKDLDLLNQTLQDLAARLDPVLKPVEDQKNGDVDGKVEIVYEPRSQVEHQMYNSSEKVQDMQKLINSIRHRLRI